MLHLACPRFRTEGKTFRGDRIPKPYSRADGLRLAALDATSLKKGSRRAHSRRSFVTRQAPRNSALGRNLRSSATATDLSTFLWEDPEGPCTAAEPDNGRPYGHQQLGPPAHPLPDKGKENWHVHTNTNLPCTPRWCAYRPTPVPPVATSCLTTGTSHDATHASTKNACNLCKRSVSHPRPRHESFVPRSLYIYLFRRTVFLWKQGPIVVKHGAEQFSDILTFNNHANRLLCETHHRDFITVHD